jgi:hypothetical protein
MRRPPKDAQANDCEVVTDVVPDHEKALAGIAIINPLSLTLAIFEWVSGCAECGKSVRSPRFHERSRA